MKLTNGLLALMLLCCSYTVLAQNNYDHALWQNIESAIKTKSNLEDTYTQLAALKRKALQTNDHFTVARCYYNQMLIDDHRKEDSFFFRNSAFMDSLLCAPQAPAMLRQCMHLLLAKRLEQYTRNRSVFGKKDYYAKTPWLNYTLLANTELDSIKLFHYEAANNLHALDSIDQEQLNWLISSLPLFLFAPDIHDLIFAREAELTDRPVTVEQDGNRSLSTWLSMSSPVFQQLVDSLGRTGKIEHRLFQVYRQWLLQHRSHPAAAYFVEAHFKNRLYKPYYEDAEADLQLAYETRLLNDLKTTVPDIKVYAIYQLCRLWKRGALNYFPDEKFDTAFSRQAGQLMALATANKSLIDSFPVIAAAINILKAQQLVKRLDIALDTLLPPGKPILVKINYRNRDQCWYRIVKRGTIGESPVRSGMLALPAAVDYNDHAVYDTLNPLAAGHYLLQFADHEIKQGDTGIGTLSFSVTRIALINDDEKLFVLNRETGQPLVGAVVTGFVSHMMKKKLKKNNLNKVIQLTADQGGTVSIHDPRIDSLQVVFEGDTLTGFFDPGSQDLPDQVYNRKEYKTPVEYFDEHVELHIYTDRAIYRPGQTVYYKVILLTRDLSTGQPVVVNQQNLRNGLLANHYKKWLKKAGPLWIYLLSAFYEETDSAKISPNRYGSFAGSFTIPVNAPTGEWQIQSDDLDQDRRNDGRFRVEEYKRPTFEMTLKTPDKAVLPAQPFTLTLKTRAFSGAILTGATVRYTLTRAGRLPVYEAAAGTTVIHYKEVLLQDTTVPANDKGEIPILVNDSLLAAYALTDEDNWNYKYQVKATAFNASESVTFNGSFSVSSRPVNIKLGMPSIANRKELAPVKVTTTTVEGPVGKNVRVSIYKYQPGEKYTDLEKVDQWKYPAAQLEAWFPETQFRQRGKMKEELVAQVMINTANEISLLLPVANMGPGEYRIVGECYEAGKLRGKTAASVTLFDTADQTWPVADKHFHYLTANAVSPGQKVTYYYGNSGSPVHSVYQIKYQVGNKPYTKTLYYEDDGAKGMNLWDFTVPEEAVDNLLFTHLYILDNKLHQQTEKVYINTPVKERPRLIIESYRKKLTPGGRETFTVAFKTKDRATAAEIMTTLYDASLDKLEKHSWYLPQMEMMSRPLSEYWNGAINGQATAAIRYPVPKKQEVRNPILALQGRVPGLVITQASGLLEDARMIEYGTTQRYSTANVTTVRTQALAGLSAFRHNLVIVDGVPYTGNLDSLKTSGIFQAFFLEGADAESIYGSKAAEGVLLISTKGPLKLPENIPGPPVVVRNNFQETAFFFPAVHADRDGYFRFTFTMPQSVTEWNWKLLAHTKKANFSYAERTLVTQLPLMVQPNIPVLLYQGDQVTIKSSIANLDTLAATGKVTCRIEDAVTGKDITNALVSSAQQPFTIAGSSNGITSFLVNVPKGQQNPLKITISARSQHFSDAEEHIIPVMTDNILVKENIPFRLFQHRDTTVRLPSTGGLYGVGIAITPDPRAAMINALPYLAHYSYNCAEQTFNKMLAHITAVGLMRKDNELQRHREAAAVTTEKDTAISPVEEETAGAMPWLSLTNKTAQQHRELLQLLDTVKANSTIENYFDQLLELQNEDGGITWFSGGHSDVYISAYLLAGFGRLSQQGWQWTGQQLHQYNNFIEKLVHYCDRRFAENKGLYYCYARQYWLHKMPLADSLQSRIKNFLAAQASRLDESGLGCQAMWITTAMVYFNTGEEVYHKATALLNDIRQQAAIDPENGMRWKRMADEGDLSMTSEESIAMLTEAFERSVWSRAVNAGVIQWLLNTKTEHFWSSTKATAAVIGLLKNADPGLVPATQSLHATVNDKPLTVSNSLLSGQLYAFAQTEKAPSGLTISKSDTGKVTGHIVYAYFKPVNQLAALNKEVLLEKKLYRYKTTAAVWEPVTESTVLQLADKVKVVLTIETGKTLRYIHIDDRKAGALEPFQYNSGYEYNGRLYMYNSIKTTGHQFFIDLVPPGKWDITYELKVTQEGQFTNGPAILQAMYNPQTTAYSNSLVIRTSK